MNDRLLPLFVFGTLRRGEANHHYLEGRYERCLPAELREFARGTTAHGFPAAVPAPSGRILGELFFLRANVYAETLARCDALEDLPPGTLVGSYYQRAQVQVRTADRAFTAWAYVDPSYSPPPQ